MNIEEKIYKESLKLFNRYYKYYYKRYPRTKQYVYNKYRAAFEKAAQMFCIRDNYNADLLIDSFMLDGFKFPYQLPNEKVWSTFINYLPGLHKEKSEDIQIAEEILSAFIVIKRFNTVKNFLDNKSNQLALFKNKQNYSILLLTFSKSFWEFYDNNYKSFEYDIDVEKIRNKIFALDNSEKILSYIKHFLGDDYC